MNYHIVIPARLESQRLPEKPLVSIGGKMLIEQVWSQARASQAESVVIATDSERVQAAAESFGARAVMTSAHHTSGSDRIAECADILGWDDNVLVVNLQGDEPLMPTACLDQVAGLLHSDATADAASLYWPLTNPSAASDPNAVKVVTGRDGQALYFSRSLVPCFRDPQHKGEWKRHIGLYAYRAGALRAFTAMPPSPLEAAEKLEQLRFLESGRKIAMAKACEFIPAGVDTQRDLERVRGLMQGDD